MQASPSAFVLARWFGRRRLLSGLLVVAAAPSFAGAQAVSGPFPPQTAYIQAEPASPQDGLNVTQPPRAVTHVLSPNVMPQTPIGDSGLPQPQSPPTILGGVGPAAPCDIRQFSSATVTPGGSRSVICEPTVAFRGTTNPNGTVGFYTGNWFAALSTNSGSTWSYVNPYTKFSALDAGFCCDQVCMYAPSHDAMVWYLQYSYSATTQRGSARIAYAVGNNIAANTWSSYVFTPQYFGRPVGEWLDYPDMSVSDDRIFFTSNIFNAANVYQNAVIWTMQLSQFVAGSGTVNWWFTSNIGGGGSVKLTRGTSNTMYAGAHASTSRLRIFKITSGNLVTIERDHSAYSAGPYSSLGSNGVNWAGRIESNTRDRLTGGYQTPTEYGFMWTASSRTGRAQPYVRVAKFRVNDDSFIADEDLWNGSFAFMYGAVAGNDAGHKGFVVSAGGGVTAGSNPSSFCAIVDDCSTSFAGQTVVQTAGSNASPTAAAWGDYLAVQRHPVRSLSFVGSGMGLIGGGANANQTPRYSWFGRERDNTAWINTSVWSSPVQGVPMTCQTDNQGRTSVTSVGYLSYNATSNYVITAPTVHTAAGKVYRFKEWRYRGAPYGGLSFYSTFASTLFLADDARDNVAEAVYDETRPIAIGSRNPTSGVAITVSPSDAQGSGSGTSAFTRYYVAGANVTLTAPATHNSAGFKRWYLNGSAQPIGTRTLAISVTAGTTPVAAEAEFYSHANGSFTSFCSGCPGTGNQVPVHTGSGTPEIGRTLNWNVSNTVANAPCAIYVGFSRTLYNGLPLPLNLGFLRMGPLCQLCVSIDVSLHVNANASGAATLNVAVPNAVNLVGGRIYTQVRVLDAGAPSPLPIVHSNGLDTLLGGDF